MVIFNQNEKKVAPLYPSFEIVAPRFSDANQNQKLDGNEEGLIRFYIRNTGTKPLQELNIKLINTDSIPGLPYIMYQTVSGIKLNDSSLVTIPVKSDLTLPDGQVRFNITVRDLFSDTIRTAALIIPTVEPLRPPLFSWIMPESFHDSVDFSVFKIVGLIRTKPKLSDLKLYINGRIPDDKKFTVIATENIYEYRIERTFTLNEGDNEVKIEARNSMGMVTSEPRIIKYYVPRIDQNYIESRLALVIGNADYSNSNPLRNPINDADSIALALSNVGFTVLKYLNADLKTMKKAMDDFGEKLQNYNVGLFYYAGHGMQVRGNNYLIPVDASLKVEQDVDYDCVDAGRLLGKMEAAGARTNIVILDACRDNPFQRSWAGRSVLPGAAGLAFMNAPSGSIVAYATSPGKTASDGDGKNGIYTEAILKYIDVPGLPIEDFFKSVRIEVEKKSNRTQTPWESTSLKGNFYFRIK